METCKEIHSFLFHLVQRRAPGIESVGFLGVKTCGTVQLLHSLFILPLGPYDDSTPRLCALERDVPDTRHPNIVLLTPMAFAINDTFLGSSEEEFESHMTGLSSTLLRHLDSNAHQVASASDDGARTIDSRGLIFLSGVALTLFLNLGTTPSTSSTACTLTRNFLPSNEPHRELDMRASPSGRTKNSYGDPYGHFGTSKRWSQISTHLSRTFKTRNTAPFRIRGGEISTIMVPATPPTPPIRGVGHPTHHPQGPAEEGVEATAAVVVIE